jgi:hypothetical protein
MGSHPDRLRTNDVPVVAELLKLSVKSMAWDMNALTLPWISCSLTPAFLTGQPMNSVEKALRTEIDRRERELGALRAALSALTGAAPARAGKPGRPAKAAKAAKGKGTGKRRPKTAAEKKVLSEKLKAAWKRRQNAEKKAAPAA